MIDVFDYPSPGGEARLERIVQRHLEFRPQEMKAVNDMIGAVQKNGDQALIDYTCQFDGALLSSQTLPVSETEMQQALESVENPFMATLQRAADQITIFHKRQKEKSWFTTGRPGTFLGQMVRPVDAAGVYVPGGQGGQTPLVSSVLMGAIPARTAGVKRICLATPPQTDGTVNARLLAAAHVAGVTEIYKMGSAWAIAALAFGTQTVPKVDVIVGPGNLYVTLAKKMVAGQVGIDMVAGPSEIVVIADRKASPGYVAADLIAQAEHDPLAAAMLITDSSSLAAKVQKALPVQVEALPRKKIIQEALTSFGTGWVVPDLASAFHLANKIAPEHLELLVEDAFAYIDRIRHAGAIFIGEHTPEPVGDYIAGPNHVLPTVGTARFSSALSVSHFTKKTSILKYDREALRREAADIQKLAMAEGLQGHAHAIKIRNG